VYLIYMAEKLNRRNFLRMAAMAAAGTAVSGCREERSTGERLELTRRTPCFKVIVNSSDGYCADPAHRTASGLVEKGVEVNTSAHTNFGTEQCGFTRVVVPEKGICWIKSRALKER
jgi:TAT (twin-arginine translocation) pathway-exported protein